MPLCRLAVALSVLLLVPQASMANAALELLENGGFEQGLSGWSGTGLSTAGCQPHSGGYALEIATAGSTAFAEQGVSGPIGEGNHSLRGSLMLADGSPQVELLLTWLDSNGGTLDRRAKNVTPGDTYGSFSFTSARPAGAESVRVRVSIHSAGPAAVCLDDVSLEGSSPPSPTEAPTATTTPSVTPSPTPSPSSPPQAASTPSPPAGTATPDGAVAAPSLSFINGGFEQGLEGWSKHGGELRAVASPVYAGAAAGELYSNTASTKWAYQVARIDPSRVYEFAGYLHGGPGVSRAYLRVSWYASGDGSGRALATSDSTAAIDSNHDGWVYLTTGPVLPPPGANSARPRIVFTPNGAAPAAVQFDDLSFASVQPAPTPVETEPPPPDPTEVVRESAAAPSPSPSPAAAEPNGDVEATLELPGAPPEPTPLREVLAVQADVTPGVEEASRPSLTHPPGGDDGVPFVWLAATALFAVTLGGSYLVQRRRE